VRVSCRPRQHSDVSGFWHSDWKITAAASARGPGMGRELAEGEKKNSEARHVRPSEIGRAGLIICPDIPQILAGRAPVIVIFEDAPPFSVTLKAVEMTSGYSGPQLAVGGTMPFRIVWKKRSMGSVGPSSTFGLVSCFETGALSRQGCACRRVGRFGLRTYRFPGRAVFSSGPPKNEVPSSSCDGPVIAFV